MGLEIRFLGAARTVTGSKFLLSDGTNNILIDCGMFRGEEALTRKNYEDFEFAPASLSYVILTHAHIDHSGLIPRLIKNGFNGRILSTKSTMELCRIMLPDAAHVEQQELEWRNRKRVRAGKSILEPVYTIAEADDSIRYFESHDYNELIDLKNGFKIRFLDAGHILGSAIIEVNYENNGRKVKMVFSGDIGNESQEIVKDPVKLSDADYLFVESTYGDRLHKDRQETLNEFINIIKTTDKDCGNIVIPAFAIERTQELIYELSLLYDKGEIYDFDVYVDSPLAIAATEVFNSNTKYFDKDSRDLLEKGKELFSFPSLKFIRRAEDSKALNEIKNNAIIISASGMCEAGRIKHHLKHNIWRKECSVIFTGYQAIGTLGRAIVDGTKTVKIYGEEIAVNAKIYTLGGFSGHADRQGLLNWVSNFKNKGMKIFVIHGEERSSLAFAGSIKEKFGFETVVPNLGEICKL